MGQRSPGDGDLAHWPAQPGSPLPETTIGDALRSAARRWPRQTALVDGTKTAGPRRRWSYTDLLAAAENVAHALLRRFEPGEHLAIWSANSPEWICVEFGAALAGLTLVTVNPAYRSNELEYVLARSRASGVVVAPEYRGRDLIAVTEEIRPRLPRLREIISLADEKALTHPGMPGTTLPDVRPNAIAQIQYTSGTTGFPKGAMLTHRGLAGNGRSYAEVIGAGKDDVWVNPMPLFHTAGCGLATLGAMQTGGTHVIPPEFDAANILDLVEAEHGTTMLCVPTMLMRLLDEADAGGRALRSLRLLTLGGAPVPPELVRGAEDRLGVTVAIGFGQTEASPYVTHTLPRDPHPDWVRTVGHAMPHVEIRIADPENGATLPLDAVGEICTRSAFVMTGYFDDPEATARALDMDGWLHTGDLGSMDRHGYVRIHGRLEDMIIRGGENVYPREVEDVLFEHPSVVGASVLGVPNEEWGEVVAAYVQLRPDHTVTGEELERFCREHLASFKVPRIWHVVDEFPQTASGKIQKFVLRDRLLAEPTMDAPGSGK